MDHVPTLRFVGKRCGAEALTYHLLPVKAQQHWPAIDVVTEWFPDL